jgi:hypothetical protein
VRFFLIGLGVFTIFVIAWVTYLRPWLRNQPWACDFFLWIEPIELHLYKKSEGILWARWQQFLGLVITSVGVFGGIDYTWLAFWTPDYIDPLLPLIPTILNVTGTIAERLRNDTTKPLEVVALPQEKPAEVAAVVAKVEAANEQAKEVVKEAKAEGAMA